MTAVIDRLRKSSRWAILILWAIHGVSSYAFSTTRGLAYRDLDSPTGLSYVRELQSSGSNDGIVIEIGVLFAVIGVLVRGARWKRHPSGAELAVHGGLVGFQAAFVATTEVGSAWTTVLLAHDIPLCVWMADVGALAAIVATLCCATFLRRAAGKPHRRAPG
jgi:hypothetical protein